MSDLTLALSLPVPAPSTTAEWAPSREDEPDTEQTFRRELLKAERPPAEIDRRRQAERDAAPGRKAVDAETSECAPACERKDTPAEPTQRPDNVGETPTTAESANVSTGTMPTELIETESAAPAELSSTGQSEPVAPATPNDKLIAPLVVPSAPAAINIVSVQLIGAALESNGQVGVQLTPPSPAGEAANPSEPGKTAPVQPAVLAPAAVSSTSQAPTPVAAPVEGNTSVEVALPGTVPVAASAPPVSSSLMLAQIPVAKRNDSKPMASAPIEAALAKTLNVAGTAAVAPDALKNTSAPNALAPTPQTANTAQAQAASAGATDQSFKTELAARVDSASGPAPSATASVGSANQTSLGTATLQAQTNPLRVPPETLAYEIKRQHANGMNRFEIRLDPPELGRIDVRLEVANDGSTRVHLSADRSETLDLLQRDARGLERALNSVGLKTERDGIAFSLRQDGAEAGLNREAREGGGNAAPRRFASLADEDDLAGFEAPPPGDRYSTMRINIVI